MQPAEYKLQLGLDLVPLGPVLNGVLQPEGPHGLVLPRAEPGCVQWCSRQRTNKNDLCSALSAAEVI